MRDVSLLDRENFGTFRLLEVSPTIVSVCVIVITYIVSPANAETRVIHKLSRVEYMTHKVSSSLLGKLFLFFR